MKANKIWNFLCKVTSIVDRTWRHVLCFQNAMSHRDTMIIFTKRRCLMNDACAIYIRHIGVYQDSECLIFEL